MVKKHTNRGVASWCFYFDIPGSSREKRRRVRKFGFATKKEAEAAEARARVEESKKHGLANLGEAPATLDALLESFFALHCDGNLSAKTTERYREHKAYLSPDLLALPPRIPSVQLTAEWKRLLRSGGRTRRNKTPRPLGTASVDDIAAMVSAAYNWAGRAFEGHITENPVRYSERPKVRKKRAVIVAPADLGLVLATDAGFWCQSAYLATAGATGARRGELLALRWTDWCAGRFTIERSLSQFKDENGKRRVEIKSTKEDEIHHVSIPRSLVAVLEEHRRRQNELRRQMGPRYQDQGLIFAQEDGTPLWPDSVSASISALCRRLGLPKGTSLHSLRHTHASVLLENKVPLTTVSKRLGHRSIRTTADIYAHALRAEDDQAAAAYDDFLKQELPGEGGEHAKVQ
jgi:integrase